MKLFASLLILAFLLFNGVTTWAGDTHSNTANASPTAKPASKATEVLDVGNKICPVSGEKIGTMGEGVAYEYEGKVYHFCCPMCIKDFKKDPQKYIKILEEKGELRNQAGAEQEENPMHRDHHE